MGKEKVSLKIENKDAQNVTVASLLERRAEKEWSIEKKSRKWGEKNRRKTKHSKSSI